MTPCYASIISTHVTHQCYFYVGAMETWFLRAFGRDRMKHAYNTRKCTMWESNIGIYWIDNSSHMCHPVTKPSSSSHLQFLLTFFLLSPKYIPSHCCPLNFIVIFIFEWRQNLMKVSLNIIISTLIMLWAGHMSQGVTLTTLLIYCHG
jgi:hypothetical protein